MTYDNVVFARDNMPALLNLKFLEVHGTRDQRACDLDTLAAAPLPERAKMRFGQLYLTNLAVQAAGFDSLQDYDKSISSNTIARQAKVITTNCNLGARLCNRRVQSKSKDPQAVALSAMRRELKDTGHVLTSKRVRTRTNPGQEAKTDKKQQSRERVYSLRRHPRLAKLLPHVVLKRQRDDGDNAALFDDLDLDPPGARKRRRVGANDDE